MTRALVQAGAALNHVNIAGKYNWNTNMWCLAYIMWSLITRKKPPRAPEPATMAYVPPMQPAHMAAMIPVGGPGRQTMVTYGAYLLSDRDDTFKDVDPHLRSLVARCLAANPADRPTSRLSWGSCSMAIDNN